MSTVGFILFLFQMIVYMIATVAGVNIYRRLQQRAVRHNQGRMNVNSQPNDERESVKPHVSNKSDFETTFESNKVKIMQLLTQYANTAAFGHDEDNKFEYPSIIIKYIYEFSINWSWFSQQEFIQFRDNQRIMQVLDTYIRHETIGTCHVDEITINQNNVFLFQFKYIKGSDMDAIIGITDDKFTFKNDKSIQSVGNERDCFNWGLRYDGIICYNNKHREWKTKICDQWQNGDIISLEINTMNLKSGNESMIRFWINGEEKFANLTFTQFDIVLPLRISVSAA